MSKLLIELELEESMDDWLDEIQWKRTHDCVAFESAIEECMALARQEVETECERCAEICAEVRRTALRQTTGDMAHANGIAVGAEFCERKIRGGQ